MIFHRFLLLIVATLIFAIGLVMIFSTSSAEILERDLDKSTHQALLRQILYVGAGILLILLCWCIGYRRLLRLSPYLLGFFTFLLLIVLIPGVGHEVNGSRRWLLIVGMSFQPSEFVKYVIPAYFIHQYLRYEQFHFIDFLRLIATIAIPMLLILVEPNNGTVFVIGVTIVALCLLMAISFRYWALPIFAIALVGAISAYNLPYVTARLNVYLHPELDLKGKGHQPYQAKIAAGSGETMGKGPGNSLQKLSYLPEAQNDYIAAIYAEEFGFLGMIVIITLYMTMACLGFSIANNVSERSGFYFAACITFLICFQAFLNLGVVSGLLPSTGLNLPLFSQGGSSLMANMMGIGLLLNVSRFKAPG